MTLFSHLTNSSSGISYLSFSFPLFPFPFSLFIFIFIFLFSFLFFFRGVCSMHSAKPGIIADGDAPSQTTSIYSIPHYPDCLRSSLTGCGGEVVGGLLAASYSRSTRPADSGRHGRQNHEKTDNATGCKQTNPVEWRGACTVMVCQRPGNAQRRRPGHVLVVPGAASPDTFPRSWRSLSAPQLLYK